MNDWAVLGDVQECDFALVLALVRSPDVLDPQRGVGGGLVHYQLTPVQKLALSLQAIWGINSHHF